mmetsp:Transcript_5960/g.21250  ORF Transcript_5960/g.21250 Transcript_5960/m.21250 type:complete len:207 (+) Transcript_5960:482-1102(+)
MAIITSLRHCRSDCRCRSLCVCQLGVCLVGRGLVDECLHPLITRGKRQDVRRPTLAHYFRKFATLFRTRRCNGLIDGFGAFLRGDPLSVLTSRLGRRSNAHVGAASLCLHRRGNCRVERSHIGGMGRSNRALFDNARVCGCGFRCRGECCGFSSLIDTLRLGESLLVREMQLGHLAPQASKLTGSRIDDWCSVLHVRHAIVVALCL